MSAATDVLTLLEASFMDLDAIIQWWATSGPKSPLWLLCPSTTCSSWSQGTNVISVSFLRLAAYSLNICRILTILEAYVTLSQ